MEWEFGIIRCASYFRRSAICDPLRSRMVLYTWIYCPDVWSLSRIRFAARPARDAVSFKTDVLWNAVRLFGIRPSIIHQYFLDGSGHIVLFVREYPNYCRSLHWNAKSYLVLRHNIGFTSDWALDSNPGIRKLFRKSLPKYLIITWENFFAWPELTWKMSILISSANFRWLILPHNLDLLLRRSFMPDCISSGKSPLAASGLSSPFKKSQVNCACARHELYSCLIASCTIYSTEMAQEGHESLEDWLVLLREIIWYLYLWCNGHRRNADIATKIR
jgi:hypothetical protein